MIGKSINIKKPYLRRLFYLSAVLLIFSFSDQLNTTYLRQVYQTELIFKTGEKQKRIIYVSPFKVFPKDCLKENCFKTEYCSIKFKNIQVSTKIKKSNNNFNSIKKSLTSRWSGSIQQNSNYLA